MKNQLCVQELYAPKSICFGCGPNNEQGLKIQSYLKDDKLICHFTPQQYHQAFPGMINGGIIGSVLDCHCNWTAAIFIMKSQNLEAPLCTVTADYQIKLKRPTPSGEQLYLVATPKHIEGNKAVIFGELYCKEKLTATCEGTFVAVKQGHPAYHRWS